MVVDHVKDFLGGGSSIDAGECKIYRCLYELGI
jgi:hypothetical protein